MRTILLLTFTFISMSLCSSQAQTILGLTDDNKLIGFDAIAPSQIVRGPIDLTGIPEGYEIIAMDIRPSTGELFGIAFNILTNSARLYVIDATNGAAIAVGASDIQLPLGEGHAAIDFDPVVDRLRVVGLNRLNYSLNPSTGELESTDTDVDYATGDVNQGVVPAIGAIAYSNSYLAAGTTTLYVYDQNLNVIAIQSPPNAGTLSTRGPTTVTFEQSQGRADMDIFFDPVSRDNIAYLVTRDTGMAGDGLYVVDLGIGKTTYLGQVPADFKDIAILIDMPTIEPLIGQLIYLLTKTSNLLLTIDSDNPAVIRSTAPIKGIRFGFTIVGMDVRPADLRLYALAYDSTASTSLLYTIDPVNAQATVVRDTAQTINLGSGPVAFDFNPVTDQIRVIGSQTNNNYRLDPNTAMVIATDSSIRHAPGSAWGEHPLEIGSATHTNSYRSSNTTVMYAINDATGSIAGINPPNDGQVFTFTANAFVPNQNDKTSDIDFYYDSAEGNSGFMVANLQGRQDDLLYGVEFSDIHLIGRIGLGTQITDMAVQLTYLPDTTASSVDVHAADKGLTSIIVTPNPVHEGATISFTPSDNAGVVTLIDITGRIVYNATIDAHAGRAFIPMQACSKGLYILQMKRGSIVSTTTLVRQ